MIEGFLAIAWALRHSPDVLVGRRMPELKQCEKCGSVYYAHKSECDSKYCNGAAR